MSSLTRTPSGRRTDAGLSGKKRLGSKGPMFPAEAVAAVIQPVLPAVGGIAILASRAQVPERTIWSILNNERHHVSLAVVDDLVTRGLGQPELFHDDPLSEFFEAA